VFLDEGRIRVVGEQTARPVELRTDDSTFVLRGADIEMKKSGPSGPASPLLVKLNAGDATASGAALTNGGVQLVSAGSIIPGALPAAAITDAGPGRSIGPVAQAGGLPGGLSPLPPRLTPVNLPPVALPPVARGPVVPPTLKLPPVVKLAPRAPEAPVLPFAPRLLAAPVINTTTGEITTLSTALILTVQPTYSYTTLSTSTLSTSTTTSLTTDTTILTTTTSSTTTLSPTYSYNLLSSPTLSTTTLCCTLSK
jgi:hypothetical protein